MAKNVIVMNFERSNGIALPLQQLGLGKEARVFPSGAPIEIVQHKNAHKRSRSGKHALLNFGSI